jgi:hypothetical protein
MTQPEITTVEQPVWHALEAVVAIAQLKTDADQRLSAKKYETAPL